MLLPDSPAEMGLPKKFGSWRRAQISAVENGVLNDLRFTIHRMPTGTGKSLAYISEAAMTGKRTVVLTSTKGLQNQLLTDFSEFGLADIRGKSNYRCLEDPERTCEEGIACRCVYRMTPQCDYTAALSTARRSKVVSTNYSYWVSAHKYGTGLGVVDSLVLDEAHNAHEEVSSAVQIRISYHEIEEMLGTKFPSANPSVGEWRSWAVSTKRSYVNRDILSLEADIARAGSGVKITWVRTLNHLKNLRMKLTSLSVIKENEWVIQNRDWGWQFDVIDVSNFVEKVLFTGVKNVSMVSATINNKTLSLLGLKPGTYKMYDYDSGFDPSRSTVYCVPTQRMDFRNKDDSIWRMRIDQIIQKRLDRKGVIHTVSYDRRDRIMRTSRFASLMVSNYDGEHIEETVARFKKMKPPCILVSPSVMTGYDFPNDQCRYQIISKVPFPDSRDKVIAARNARDKDYVNYLTTQLLIQASGRGCRSADDYCETFIIDDHAMWLLGNRNRHLLPKWFINRVRWVNSLPEPMALRGA